MTDLKPPDPIRLIAIDLDGTLLDPDHRMSARNAQAIRAAVAQGVQVVIATGKTQNSAYEILAELGLKTPGVYVQGLNVYDPDWNLIHEQTLSPDVVDVLAELADAEKLTIVAYNRSRILVRERDFHTDRLLRYGETDIHAVGSLKGIGVPINKAMYIGKPAVIRPLRGRLTPILTGRAMLVQSVSNEIEETIEILPFNTSKGHGLMWLLNHMGVDPKHVMALGDGENDVEMLQFVGWGVAMANANPHLKAVANALTASNTEDGVAQAIERYVLGA